MASNLTDIELFAGKYWFTLFENGKGTIQGPFVTKHEAEQARKKYVLQETTQCQKQSSSPENSSQPSSSVS